MPWNAPKTDWKPGDVVLYTDFNRIEGNIDFLKVNFQTQIDTANTNISNLQTQTSNLQTQINNVSNNLNSLTVSAQTQFTNISKEYLSRKLTPGFFVADKTFTNTFGPDIIRQSSTKNSFLPINKSTALVTTLNSSGMFTFYTLEGTNLISRASNSISNFTVNYRAPDYYSVVSTRSATVTDVSAFETAFVNGRPGALFRTENKKLYRMFGMLYFTVLQEMPKQTTNYYTNAVGESAGYIYAFDKSTPPSQYTAPDGVWWWVNVISTGGYSTSLLTYDVVGGESNPRAIKLPSNGNSTFNDMWLAPVYRASWHYYNAVVTLCTTAARGDREVGIFYYDGQLRQVFVDLTDASSPFASKLGSVWNASAYGFSPEGLALIVWKTTYGNFVYALYDLSDYNVTGWSKLLTWFETPETDYDSGYPSINFHQIYWLGDNLWGEAIGRSVSKPGICKRYYIRTMFLTKSNTAITVYDYVLQSSSWSVQYLPHFSIYNDMLVVNFASTRTSLTSWDVLNPLTEPLVP